MKKNIIDIMNQKNRESYIDLKMQKEIHAKEFMGITFRQSIRCRIEKPAWMPMFIYRLLMRTIVQEETQLKSEVK